MMELIAPSGPVYQAGTLSGNPLAMAAGYATLRHLAGSRSMYKKLESLGRVLEEGIRKSFADADVPVQVNRVGSMFTAFFTSTEVVDYETAKTSDTKRFATFFRVMLERGVYLPPSQFEAAFISAAHSEQTIRRTIQACRVAAQHLRKT
jgi:glutamate-1-semialdehyde 2,1-aminomutase